MSEFLLYIVFLVIILIVAAVVVWLARICNRCLGMIIDQLNDLLSIEEKARKHVEKCDEQSVMMYQQALEAVKRYSEDKTTDEVTE